MTCRRGRTSKDLRWRTAYAVGGYFSQLDQLTSWDTPPCPSRKRKRFRKRFTLFYPVWPLLFQWDTVPIRYKFALSRRRQGFKSPWGRQTISIGYAPVAFKSSGSVYRDCVPALLICKSGEPFFLSAKLSTFAGPLPSITDSTFCPCSSS